MSEDRDDGSHSASCPRSPWPCRIPGFLSPTPDVLTVNSPQISCLDPTSRVLTLYRHRVSPSPLILPLTSVSLSHV